MRTSVRFQLVLFAVALVLVVGGGIGVYALLTVRSRLLEEFAARSRLLVAAAAEDLAGDLYLCQVGHLRRKLATLKADPNVEAAHVLDTEGRVLTDGTDANPQRDRRLTDAAAETLLARQRIEAWWRGSTLYVGGPVFLPDGTHVGFLRVRFSAAHVQALAAGVLREAGLLIALALVLGVGVAALVAHRFSRPLQAVAAAARAVGRGEFNVRLPLKRRDEVGELARAVSQMASHRRAAEEALTAARDAALESARMKSRFLANMSHEIRTPMNGVLGMADLLLESELTPEQREYCETIRGCGQSLLEILNDVLDFSKIEAGMLEVAREPFDFLGATEGVVRLLAEKATNGRVELAVDPDPALPPRALGDEGRYRQVLTNLVGNALKFTERGHVIVRLRRDEDHLRVAVEDTGIGIPAEAQQRIFAPFAQASARTSRHYGGTGLGLSIAKELTERMGGRIGLTSAPGRGATFWFTLPLVDGPPRAPRKVAAGRTALCLYAEEGVRTVLVRLLEARGCRVIARGDRRSAPAGTCASDLCFLDENLPGDPGAPAPPAGAVVLVCRRNAPLPPAAAKSNTLVLAKPILPSGVDRVLREALGLAAEAPDRADAPAPPPSPLRGFRILVAEDDRVNQKVIAKLLGRLGCEVELVPNGRLALERLARRPFDLVLMDCEMPEMDGLTAAREIRRRVARGELRRVPVVALTAHAMKGHAERCRAAGMDDYLTKPVARARLEGTLRKWLRRGADAPAKSFPEAGDGAKHSVMRCGRRERDPGGADSAC